jgi:chromosome segregation ATPase
MVMGNNGLRSVALGLRQRVVDRVVGFIDFRVKEGLQDHERRIDHQEHCTDDHRRRLDEAEAALREVRDRLHWTANEVERLIPHVSSQESQLEALRQKLTVVPAADEPELTAARSLIEEIQREHAQVRVRLTGIAQYEDRLRKLEAQRPQD